MTENEAKDYFEAYIKFCEKDGIGIPSREPYDLAISALEEIQKYRSLGTAEELKALKESALSGLELANIWAALRQLKKYEDTGLTPEQLKVIDEEYSRMAHELAILRK